MKPFGKLPILYINKINFAYSFPIPYNVKKVIHETVHLLFTHLIIDIIGLYEKQQYACYAGTAG